MDRQSVDVIVIGSGQGGTSLAAKLAKRGRRVSLFERSHLGGACVNEGCTPSKTLLASAHAVGAVRRAAKLGVDCGPSASAPVADFERVMRRVREVRHAWREGVETVDEVENLEVVPADATFAGPHVVRGDGVERGAERIVINTGRSARAPEIPGLGEAPIHTTESIFELEHRPRRLGVLGAGYVGLELGQAFARLGCEVVLTDRGTRVLHHEAADVSESLEAALREDGVRLRLGVRVDRVEAIDGGAACVLHFNDGSRQQVDALLLAAGRAPNTGSLAVDRAGVELDERGYVKVNDRFETTAEGVYAIGSVAGQAPFTHSSSEDGRRLLAIW